MKLVLLPGLDGTGILFKDFIGHLSNSDVLVIPLPQIIHKDYGSIVESIKSKLPQDDFILLAESFSGGLVPFILAKYSENIKGIIFVASFLSPPHSLLLRLSSYIPFTFCRKLPLAQYFEQLILYDKLEEGTLKEVVIKTIKSIPTAILKNRLSIIHKMEFPSFSNSIPVCYIAGRYDRLINRSKSREIKNIFSNMELSIMEAPHLVLQCKPRESAKTVNLFIDKCLSK